MTFRFRPRAHRKPSARDPEVVMRAFWRTLARIAAAERAALEMKSSRETR